MNGKNGIVFSQKDFESLTHKFVEDTHASLLCYPQTATLTTNFKARITDTLSKPEVPNLIIMGAQGTGRSTLLNALIGAQAAPIGNTETTLTFNRFQHGEGKRCSTVDIHWRNGRTEAVSQQDIQKRLENETYISEITLLDFFVDSDFLRTVNVVDTPGTGGTFQSHDQMLQEFLAGTHPATTRHGVLPHMMLYVTAPDKVDQEDEEAVEAIIEEFNECTHRLGILPQKSVIVVQKRDMNVPASKESSSETDKFCKLIEEELVGNKPRVLPTSASLAIASRDDSNVDWELLTKLGQVADTKLLTALKAAALLGSYEQLPRSFDKTAHVTNQEWRELIKRVGWDALNFSLSLAHLKKNRDADALKEAVSKESRIGELQEFLITISKTAVVLTVSNLALRVHEAAVEILEQDNETHETHKRKTEKLKDTWERIKDDVEMDPNVITKSDTEIRIEESISHLLAGPIERFREALYDDLDTGTELVETLQKVWTDVRKKIPSIFTDVIREIEVREKELLESWDTEQERVEKNREILDNEGFVPTQIAQVLQEVLEHFKRPEVTPSVVDATGQTLEYLDHSIDSIENRVTLTEDLLKELGKSVTVFKDNYELFEQEARFLAMLQYVVDEDKETLELLFGKHGSDVSKRLGYTTEPDDTILIRRASELYDRWLPDRDSNDFYGNAVERLDMILDFLQGKPTNA